MHENIVILEGNLTRDPELSYTKNGRPKTVLGLAVSRRWKNRNSDKWEEHVSFFNVVCWADLANHVAESLAQGDRVRVSGRLEQRSWTTDSDEKRSIIEVVAGDVAPSLRFNTVAVDRSDKDAPDANDESDPPPVTYPEGEEPF